MEFNYKIELIFVGLHTQDTYLFDILFYFVLKYMNVKPFYEVKFIIEFLLSF